MISKLYGSTLRNNSIFTLSKMAKSSFEYVKNFEMDDKVLPNAWIVVRIDGKSFHKFSENHSFEKPNDIRALHLMNHAAMSVMQDLRDIVMAFGQSDEYSFVFRKSCDLYKRRAAKLLTNVNSKFSSSYVYYWKKYFGDNILKYPPSFDGRLVVYPSDKNLIDYMKWRQADVHINNLYNTTFWKLILEGNLTPTQAEKKLCGTVSADKNEILFKEFNINYNKEPEIFKRGTLLVWNTLSNEKRTVIVDLHSDMLKEKFWTENSNLLMDKYNHTIYDGSITNLIQYQLTNKKCDNCDSVNSLVNKE